MMQLTCSKRETAIRFSTSVQTLTTCWGVWPLQSRILLIRPSPLEESKALASAFMHALSEGIQHATGLFSRLQANCLLARREVLASSTLPEWDRTTLRSLPSNSLEFFGQKLRPFSQLGRRRSSKMPRCEWLWFLRSLLA